MSPTRTPTAPPPSPRTARRPAATKTTKTTKTTKAMAPKRPAAPRKPTDKKPATRPANGSATSWRPTAVLLTVVGLLCLIGLMMVLSASSVQALRDHDSSWYFFKRQLVFVFLGAGALLVGARVDYRFWQRIAMPLVLVTMFLLALVLVPGVGIRVSGSSRWLGVGALQFQPSEVAKMAVIAFLASLLARRADRMDEPEMTLYPSLAVLGLFVGLVMLQPDMGTTIVIVSSAFAILFVAGVPLRSMATLAAVGVLGGLVLGLAAPYRRARITAFLDPWADASNTGYQVVQSLAALGSGRLTGVGLGESRAKWGFLPNSHTDFIFAIIGDEAGLIGTLTVVVLFLVLAGTGVRAARRAPDRFGMLLAVGLTGWITVQAIVNIGAVIQMLPITGVPLPFVSYGGSSLIICMGVTGVLLNVLRQGR